MAGPSRLTLVVLLMLVVRCRGAVSDVGVGRAGDAVGASAVLVMPTLVMVLVSLLLLLLLLLLCFLLTQLSRYLLLSRRDRCCCNIPLVHTMMMRTQWARRRQLRGCDHSRHL